MILREICDKETIWNQWSLSNIALVDIGINHTKRYTFKDLENNINYFASGIKKLNLVLDSKIAIISHNSFKFIVAYYGIKRAGLIPVLINCKMPYNQIEKIIAHSETKHIFFSNEYQSKIIKNIPSTSLDSDFDSFIKKEIFKENLEDLERPAFILYTSGSTGMPKAVAVPTKNRKWIINKTKGPKSRKLTAQPLYHNGGLSTVEQSLLEQGTVILMPKFNPEDFVNVIINHKPRIVYAVPTMLAMILQKNNLVKLLKGNTVTTIILASAPLTLKLYKKIKDTFPLADIRNRYGSSELGPSVFDPHHVNKSIPTPPLSVGYPRDGIECKLINDVLYVKSPAMIKKYYKNLNNILTDDGFYNTKDRFKIDENGFYFFLGRSDDMFTSGGNNIYPSEVENVLETHPDVIKAQVIGLQDDIKGEKPYAFVASNNKELREHDLKEYFLNNAAAYQLPRKIWFLDEWPITSLNKIDKEKLKEIAKEKLS
jgi:long-chain acyl-CoA synthetase